MVAELRRVKYNDLEDKVYWMDLTVDENVDIMNVKCIAGSTNGFTLLPKINQITQVNLIFDIEVFTS